MPPKLIVSQNVIERLQAIKKPCTGNIYGVLYDNSLLIIGLHQHDEQQVDVPYNLPTEIDLYGTFQVHRDEMNEEELKRLVCDVDVTDTPLHISCKIQKDNLITTHYHVNNRLENVTFETTTTSDVYSQFVHVRLITQLNFLSEVNKEQIRSEFGSLRKHLAHGQVAFNFPKTDIYLMGSDNENSLVGLTGDPSIGEMLKQSTEASEGCAPSYKKKKGQNLEVDVLKVVMFKKMTQEPGSDLKIHAPVVHFNKRSQKSIQLAIDVDTLSIIHRNSKVVELYTTLVESCCRSLRYLETEFLAKFKDENSECVNISKLEVFHFFPDICGHFITKAYFTNESEKELESTRQLLHKQLLLPLTQPFFKRANRFVFKSDKQSELVNPHEGVNLTDNGGEVALIRGKYSYYHYCQNNMDDNGWGCAYRSLQTLASWFRWQGYTEELVPTYPDIQKCLVDLGDKPSSFAGSKQWIGSTEVSYVLNALMNVTCKILHVSSGEEMAAKGPELINHFKLQGSPVMIGGGVLAHTILGVDYNSSTGNLKFLILDPHYTGSEDLNVIQKKGWCGWKGVDFWDKTAYYNMCLPQVPLCF